MKGNENEEYHTSYYILSDSVRTTSSSESCNISWLDISKLVEQVLVSWVSPKKIIQHSNYTIFVHAHMFAMHNYALQKIPDEHWISVLLQSAESNWYTWKILFRNDCSPSDKTSGIFCVLFETLVASSIWIANKIIVHTPLHCFICVHDDNISKATFCGFTIASCYHCWQISQINTKCCARNLHVLQVAWSTSGTCKNSFGGSSV